MKGSRRNRTSPTRHALVVGFWAFLLGAASSLASQTLVKEMTYIVIAFIVLVIIILIGIIFDIIGVAVTAAREGPLHSRASHRVFGARQALWMTQNAPHVASFCNDIVGDVSGALSGAVGVTIVFKLLEQPTERAAVIATTLMTAFVAAFIVGGKAYGKAVAIHNGTAIIFHTGQVIAWIEETFHVTFIRPRRPAAQKREKRESSSSKNT